MYWYHVLYASVVWLVCILLIALFFRGATEKSVPETIQQKLRGK